MRFWYLLLVAVVSLALAGLCAGEELAPAAQYGKVECLRDSWGIPHIFSDTDEGAMYGLGYATAEDRAFQMYYTLRTVQGRLAEVIGDARTLNGRDSALEHDIQMRHVGFYRAAQELTKHLDPGTVSLLEAYSRGVNDYVSRHRDKLLYLFDKLGLEPEPWTPAACIASWWRLGAFFESNGLGDALRASSGGGGRGGAPRWVTGYDYAAVIQQEDVSAEWLKQVNEFYKAKVAPGATETGAEGAKFSHAWVVGGNKSTTGAATLCSDPQTPVRNPSLWYEFHVCGKTFNARGGGVAGSPVILIGWNENVAWGMTALGADQADLFILKTDQEHPNQYLFDDKWRDIKVSRETIKVKGGEAREIEIKQSHLGPIVTAVTGKPSDGGEVALKRLPISDTDRETIQGALGMMRAKDVKEFLAALGGWRFPSANCIFGDKTGGLGYSILGALPVRSPLSASSGSAHDGSASKYDWQGIVPPGLVPQMLDPKRGYIGTANHRPIGSFYPIPLGTGVGSGGDTVRSWRLRERLEMKDKMTPEDVLDVHYDMVNAAKREMVRMGYHARDVMKATLSEDALKALAYLEEWYKNGAKSDLTIKGTELADAMPTQFRANVTPLAGEYGGGDSGQAGFLNKMKTLLDENPQAQLGSAELAFVAQTLAQAWQNAVRQYGDDPALWHEKALQALARQKIGYFVSLDGFPSLDPEKDIPTPALRDIDGATISCRTAESYTQWVPLNDVDTAKTITPIGQSELPDSPYRLCNLEAWAKGELHPAPITRKAVEKYAVATQALLPSAEKPVQP